GPDPRIGHDLPTPLKRLSHPGFVAALADVAVADDAEADTAGVDSGGEGLQQRLPAWRGPGEVGVDEHRGVAGFLTQQSFEGQDVFDGLRTAGRPGADGLDVADLDVGKVPAQDGDLGG